MWSEFIYIFLTFLVTALLLRGSFWRNPLANKSKELRSQISLTANDCQFLIKVNAHILSETVKNKNHKNAAVKIQTNLLEIRTKKFS